MMRPVGKWVTVENTYADILHELIDGHNFVLTDKQQSEMHEVLDNVGLTRTPTEENDEHPASGS